VQVQDFIAYLPVVSDPSHSGAGNFKQAMPWRELIPEKKPLGKDRYCFAPADA